MVRNQLPAQVVNSEKGSREIGTDRCTTHGAEIKVGDKIDRFVPIEEEGRGKSLRRGAGRFDRSPPSRGGP